MKKLQLVVCSVALVGFGQFAEAEGSCPSTVGSDLAIAESWPKTDTWHGSESLAIILPRSGIWPTGPARLTWYSSDFQPGLEREFVGRIERLDEGPNDAAFLGATNARLADEAWTILTAFEFGSEGCWRIVGEYRGRNLEFVVRTVDYEALDNKRPDD